MISLIPSFGCAAHLLVTGRCMLFLIESSKFIGLNEPMVFFGLGRIRRSWSKPVPVCLEKSEHREMMLASTRLNGPI